MRTRQSFGIACCRFNGAGKPEILLVCKRYTYAYNLFVHAKYSSGDNAALMALFNGMTIDEKLDILSLNFSQIWYRIWFNGNMSQSYYVAKNKFETTFLLDNGTRLRRLIHRSTNAQRIWEIPKGRKNRNESDLHCAIREFSEESGMERKAYHIQPHFRRAHDYVDAGTRYMNTFFAAVAISATAEPPRVSYSTAVGEICDIQWMTIEQIRFVDPHGRIEQVARPLFNYLRRRRRRG